MGRLDQQLTIEQNVIICGRNRVLSRFSTLRPNSSNFCNVRGNQSNEVTSKHLRLIHCGTQHRATDKHHTSVEQHSKASTNTPILESFLISLTYLIDCLARMIPNMWQETRWVRSEIENVIAHCDSNFEIVLRMYCEYWRAAISPCRYRREHM